MSNLSQRFNNLSLYKKILLILSTTLLFVFFAFVVGIQLLSQYYARELYTSNAQSLNYVSSFVSARMETVESGSARILSDTIIQTNLTDIMDAPTSIRNAQRKQTIYQALYPYIFDDDYMYGKYFRSGCFSSGGTGRKCSGLPGACQLECTGFPREYHRTLPGYPAASPSDPGSSGLPVHSDRPGPADQ